jgi:NADPH:quinone reductase
MGGTVACCDMDLLALKRLQLMGVSNRLRTPEQRADCVTRFWSDLSEVLRTGALKPRVDREFSWGEASAAQAYLEAGRHIGKVVINVRQ